MSYKSDMARIRAEIKKEEEESARLGAIPCSLCGSHRVPFVTHHPEFGMRCVKQDTHDNERVAALIAAIRRAGDTRIPWKEITGIAVRTAPQLIPFLAVCEGVGTDDSYKAAVMMLSFPYQYGNIEAIENSIKENPKGVFVPMGFAFEWRGK
jgi:hypothetical protein